MKKSLKIGLIVGGSLLIAGGTWAGLTKAGIIPNRFGIELLCSNTNFNILSVGNNENLIKEDHDGLLWQLIQPAYDDTFTAVAGKPIIYLYPTIETEVHVKLGTPENLLHTYPKYNFERGRNVIVEPNGDLEDIDTGRKLYALYWEGKNETPTNFDEGFVVKGEDIMPFLEEKLALLGLNERESEEFIVYWLPQMENNEWNLIRFETKAEQDENMPLNITPKPDTLIRVMMDWKAIDGPIDIPEQQFESPERNGFTVVERGGSPRN